MDFQERDFEVSHSDEPSLPRDDRTDQDDFSASAETAAAFDQDTVSTPDIRLLLATYAVLERDHGREESEGFTADNGVEIYRVQDENLIARHQEELLYVIDSKTASEDARDRFVQGLAAVARLAHPNIVKISRVGIHRESGRVFFTMANEEQINLRNRIDELSHRGKGMAPIEAAELTQRIASALAAAHRRQAPHFGLRPERVWLTSDGAPHVAGFGIARLLEQRNESDEAEPTEDASPYAMPERVRTDQSSQGVDVYSLGAILYELLTLYPPDTGGDLVLPRHYNPDIPLELEEICLRCLDPNRQDWFGTIDELAFALSEFISDTTLAPDAVDQPRLGDTLDAIRADDDDERHFGNYELLENKPIGKGGMGKVYRVRNRNPILGDRVEALKVISSRKATPQAREQFITEISVMARLQHPNIVPVYDAGEEHGQLFFTMSLERGGDLAQLVQRNRTNELAAGEQPLTATRAAEIVRDVALAIEMAHSHEIMHRDLKPANVLLSASGTPRVTDFGLAELMAPGDLARSDSGTDFRGTPAYMSPEQARGDLLDERTDVYSLGAILYELLTKHPPFASSSSGMKGVDEIIDAVKHRPLVPPREIDPTIPRQLEAICLKAMSKSRQDRYATAADFKEALEEFLRPAQWRPTRRFVLGAALTGMLLAVSFWLLSAYREREEIRLRKKEALRRATQQQEQILGEARGAASEAAKSEDGLKHQEAFALYSQATSKFDRLIGGELLVSSREQLTLEWCRAQVRLAFLEEEAERIRDADSRIHEVRDRLRHSLKAPRMLSFVDRESKKVHDSHNPIDELWTDLSYLLPSRKPAAAEMVLLLAEAYHQDARYHMQRADHKGALVSYGRSLVLRRILSDSHEENRRYKRDLAKAYGYIADTYLEMNKVQAAQRAYSAAEAIRSSLAQSGSPSQRADDDCLHARDFGNWCRFHLWQGELDEALKQATERLEYYENRLREKLLPLEFLTERADAYVTAAELELDASTDDYRHVREWLDRAEGEYRQLRDRSTDKQIAKILRHKQARLRLVRGKWELLKKNANQARDELDRAIDELKLLMPDSPTFRDYYDLARGHALLVPLSENPGDAGYHERTAVDLLEQAIKAGFRDLKQLELDRCFDHVKSSSGEWSERVVEPIKASRAVFNTAKSAEEATRDLL